MNDPVLVTAQEGQYHIQDGPERLNPWPDPVEALTTGEDNWIAVITGTQWGPVTVHHRLLSKPPTALDPDWDMIAERDIVTSTGRLHVSSPIPPARASPWSPHQGATASAFTSEAEHKPPPTTS
ncbi:hypothetical protein [Actinocorallia libanotica]|uniref:Uncharacterized protein n=1 Tax=Actinocorallia libanotica TaxID=46162 RepID=A0ABN1S3A8_9ACTN